MARPLSLMSCLGEIEDPRWRGFAHRHDLQEMLVIAICAVLYDADSFEEMAFWAQRKEYWLRRFLRLRGGLPSHDTFNRVFRLIDQKAFESAFRRWVAGLVPAVGDGTLAVDGKTVRGSADAMAGPIHLVSAFATRLGVVLGQQKVAGKRNELSAMAELLDALNLRGYLVTLDAPGLPEGSGPTDLREEGRLCPGRQRQPARAARGPPGGALRAARSRAAASGRALLRGPSGYPSTTGPASMTFSSSPRSGCTTTITTAQTWPWAVLRESSGWPWPRSATSGCP